MEVSPDGKRAVAGYSHGEVILFDPARTRQRERSNHLTLGFHLNPVFAVAFTPDGTDCRDRRQWRNHITLGRAKWPADGRRTDVHRQAEDFVEFGRLSLEFSRDGTTLVCGGMYNASHQVRSTNGKGRDLGLVRTTPTDHQEIKQHNRTHNRKAAGELARPSTPLTGRGGSRAIGLAAPGLACFIISQVIAAMKNARRSPAGTVPGRMVPTLQIPICPTITPSNFPLNRKQIMHLTHWLTELRLKSRHSLRARSRRPARRGARTAKRLSAVRGLEQRVLLSAVRRSLSPNQKSAAATSPTQRRD